MSGIKSKNTKKSTIIPEWVDDEETLQVQSPTKRTTEDDAKLFRDAIEFERIPQKDIDLRDPTKDPIKVKRSIERYDIDLHGLTVDEAQHHVVQAIEEILSKSKGQVVNIRVITGKGLRSRGKEPQLIHSIHHVVESRFKSRLVSIEVSPHELKIGDSYLKGHFDLKIR